MVTSFNLVYSISAVRRLLNLPIEAQVKIQQFAKVIWVWVNGKRPTFISKKLFNQHFVDRRKAEAKSLRVWQIEPDFFSVVNPANSNSHYITLTPSGPACDCEDYKNQMQFLGRGCCKHGYATLSYLGFNSLAEFLQ